MSTGVSPRVPSEANTSLTRTAPRVKEHAMQIPVIVFGASGYSGIELLRLLTRIPEVHLVAASSDKWAGRVLSDAVPGAWSGQSFRTHAEVERVAEAGQLVFLATPAESSLALAPKMLARGLRVIDLSGAFRLADAAKYPEWYGFTHEAPALLAEAVYGLPQLFPVRADARLVANPGCYATAAALAAAPLVREGLVDLALPLMLDGKSGTTGAGRKADEAFSFSEVADTLRPYRVGKHQHVPEIEQTLARYSGREVRVSFVPHLIPMRRGLIVSGQAIAKDGVTRGLIEDAYRAHLGDKSYVRLSLARPADPGTVLGTNHAEVSVSFDPRTRVVSFFGALDNLMKGAAGQAIENLAALTGVSLARAF